MQASTSTQVVVASTTYADSGLTATITPTLATSKVLVLVSQMVQAHLSSTGTATASLRLLRGATTLLTQGSTTLIRAAADGAGQLAIGGNTSLLHLDSPASTSALTYKTQVALYSGSDAVAQANSSPSTIILMEVSA